MADKIIKYMSQEWIDQLNEEFEQLRSECKMRESNGQKRKTVKKACKRGKNK